MLEIAIQDIQQYDLKSIQEQVTLNINGDKYLLNPTLDNRQYVMTLISDDVDKSLECFKEWMIIAQSIMENMPIIGCDKVFKDYDVNVFW